MADKASDKGDATSSAATPKPTASSGAESPRTAREPDFDDDVPETTHLSPPPERQPTPQKRVSFQDDVGPAPPPKPPRPMSPQAQAEATLTEAFPDIDPTVVKAVLVASGGKVEPAFNALLGMSDPTFKQEQSVPTAAPRQRQPREQLSQLEADEQYARELAEQYNTAYNSGSSYSGYGSRSRGDPPAGGARRDTGLKPNELYDKEHSFIDDDLPVIRQNLEKGFQETRTKINQWITNFQKRLDGDSDEETIPPRRDSNQRQNYGPSQSSQLYGIQRSAEAARRSQEHGRGYDADPQLLSDDFGHRLELRDDEAPPTRPPRPLANPDLFTASAGNTPPHSTAPQEGVPQSLARGPSPAAGAKAGKWQPLSSVEPNPVGNDHDPFSLGDSDEELEAKKETKTEEAKKEETKKDAGSPSKPAADKPAAESTEEKKADTKGSS